jgi:outer membrane protein assembly factor BamB
MKRLQGVIAVAVGILLGFLSLVVFSACGPTQPLNIENIDLSDDAPQVQAPQAETPQPEAIQAETPDDTQLASTDDINRSAEPAVAADAPAGDPSQKSAPVEPGDWPQWCGTSYRNNAPIAENIPSVWNVGSFDRKTGAWQSEEAQNIKWVAPVGSQTYGNPVVASGQVYIGTNNGAGYLKRYPSTVDLGCLLAFSESDGSLLWQHSSEKLSTGRVHDWPLQGICCAPLVEGERLWFVSSRGYVLCLDTKGYYDGEDDGPVTKEWIRLLKVSVDQKAGLDDGTISEELRESFSTVGFALPDDVAVRTDDPGKKWSFDAIVEGKKQQFQLRAAGPSLLAHKQTTTDDKNEADTIWTFDMMNELGVSQHNMCSCSVTALGDILFVNTSNGVDETHINIPAVDAPSFIAMDKNTGEVLWTDSSPGKNVLHGQWSSPTVGELGGVPQVIFAGGDGWVYSFRADRGQEGKPELLWKFDANPKTSEWILGGRGTRNNVIATPVIHEGRVYVAVGQDPEHGEGIGHLWCLDPNRRGDISAELAVHIDDRGTPIAHRRLQAVNEEEGEIAVDNVNSAVIWHYSENDQNGDGEIDFEETMHRSCGTVAIKDNLLYIADFSGLFHCLDATTGAVHWTYDMFAAAWGSSLIVDGKVFIGDEDGDLAVFPLTADRDVALVDDAPGIAEINMKNSVYSTPIVANGVLYISNKTHLFAIAND